jgi:hypothetical protein
MGERPTDREVTDFVLAACRAHGCDELTALRCAHAFLAALRRAWAESDDDGRAAARREDDDG